MKIIDQSGSDVTAARRDVCVELALNSPPRTTGLEAGDRLCDNNGAARFLADGQGSGYIVNCPPPHVLIEAWFEEMGLAG